MLRLIKLCRPTWEFASHCCARASRCRNRVSSGTDLVRHSSDGLTAASTTVALISSDVITRVVWKEESYYYYCTSCMLGSVSEKDDGCGTQRLIGWGGGGGGGSSAGRMRLQRSFSRLRRVRATPSEWITVDEWIMKPSKLTSCSTHYNVLNLVRYLCVFPYIYI